MNTQQERQTTMTQKGVEYIINGITVRCYAALLRFRLLLIQYNIGNLGFDMGTRGDFRCRRF